MLRSCSRRPAVQKGESDTMSDDPIAMDRLVKLYQLPDPAPNLASLVSRGISIRRARSYEKTLVVQWVRAMFSQGWADECSVCFSRTPVSCFIATTGGEIVGFACHDATYKNFFGPIGIAKDKREGGVGAALLLACLSSMREAGYAYAIIGGPKEAAPFYRRVVGAIDIPGSNPGIYIDRINGSDS